MASFDQKLRTLRLMEILLERTDDAHMLNASELCTILDQEYGISTDRRTIYTEMEILEKFGLDIQQKKGKNPGYYIGAIIDRFGHDVWLIPQGEDHFKTRVLVSVSPQFFGWVTGIGFGMKITGPENVKQQYKEYMLDVLQNY